MTPLPTPDNPVIFRVVFGTGRTIPSMKNAKVPIYTKTGKLRLIKNRTVQQFKRAASVQMQRQWSEQGFDLSLLPQKVHVWAEVVRFCVKGRPDSDLDNQYTTLQELLQNLVVQDDSQVASFHCEESLTQRRLGQLAYVYVWVDTPEEEAFLQHVRFYVWNKARQARMTQQDYKIPTVLQDLLKSSS